MSTLSQFFGGGVKSVQTGYFSTTTTTAGVGEDAQYADLTISPVDTAKSICLLVSGGASNTTLNTNYISSGSSVAHLKARLLNSTTLRFSNGIGFFFMAGRWVVVEYA